MKVVELFAGIGGFRAGFQDAADESNRVVSFPFVSEWDKFAQKSYEAIWGEIPHGDITKIEAKDIPDHDILVGGFPCQAFSAAGKMKGFDDARGTLFFDMARIAKEKQPKAILMENVKGLVGHDKGNTLDVMARTLWDIGYRIDFDILNSCMFGVPQNRERIFIVAIRKDLINKQEWVVKGNTVVPKGKKRIGAFENADTFNFPYPVGSDTGIRLRDILEPVEDIPETMYIDQEKTDKLLAELSEVVETVGTFKDGEFASLCGSENIAANLDVNYAKGMDPSDIKANRARRSHIIVGLPIKEATKQGYALAKEGDSVNIQFPGSTTRRGRVGSQIANTLEASGINQGVVVPVLTPERTTKRQNGRQFKDNGDDAFTLTAQDRHGVLVSQPKMIGLLEIKGTEQVRRVYDVEGLSPTLTTMQEGNQEPKIMVAGNVNPSGTGMNGSVYDVEGLSPTLTTNKGEGPKTLVNLRIRKLTPLECWRLQAFDDDMFYRAKDAGISNSQLYKQAGNSVTTTVIKELALKLFDLLDAAESGELAPPPGQTNIFDFM